MDFISWFLTSSNLGSSNSLCSYAAHRAIWKRQTQYCPPPESQDHVDDMLHAQCGGFFNWAMRRSLCHHRFQQENGLLTWMLSGYWHFWKPPCLSCPSFGPSFERQEFKHIQAISMVTVNLDSFLITFPHFGHLSGAR